jgi:N-acetylglucosamine-6-sulfatase
MDRRSFLQTLGLGAAGWATTTSRPDPPSEAPEALEAPAVRGESRPNILFIFSDDHTPQSIRSYANAASIPTVDDRLGGIARSAHIDRIAAEGARVDHCFCTNSICCPSRASVLTGQYSHEHGVYTLEDGLDPARPHVAKALRAAGYRTALFGKWHLKNDPAGFDDWLRLPGQGRYFDPKLKAKGEAEYTAYEGFSSDVITEQSIEWLRAQADRDAPFFLMTNYKTCHGPFAYPERNADLFADTAIPEPPSLWEDKAHRSPGSRDYGLSIETMAHRLVREPFGGWTPPRPLEEMAPREMRRHAHQRFVTRYLRSAAAIDQGVGRLLDYLDEAGLAENTIVVYSSDQGYYLGEHNYIDKRWMYEESLRMPFLVRYPDGIEPGTTVDDLVLNVDMAPTLLDFAGVEPPDYMQGRSARPQLQGRARDDWRDALYYRYWYHTANGNRPAHYGVRTDRYKLIFFYGLPLSHGDLERPTEPGMELYDLAKDPQEMDNVYGDPAYRDVAERLKRTLLRKKEELGDTDEGHPELLDRRSSFF